MSETTEKGSEKLKNSTNSITKKSSDENISFVESEKINPNQEREIMEVHKHPHHVTQEKKWPEYLLEFLMIFFAVTMGFIAENIREESVEKGKAKEYAISLIKDIEKDNFTLKFTLDIRIWREQKLDSLSQMLSKPLVPEQYNDIYYFSIFLYNPLVFPSSDATFQGLKNSGSMRYFKSIKLQSQVYNYYVLYSSLKDDNNDRSMMGIEANKLTSQILKEEYFSKIRALNNDGISYYDMIHRLNYPTTLLSNDPVLLNQLASLAQLEKKKSSFFVGIAPFVQKEGNDLITSLKKEYNIQDVSKEK